MNPSLPSNRHSMLDLPIFSFYLSSRYRVHKRTGLNEVWTRLAQCLRKCSKQIPASNGTEKPGSYYFEDRVWPFSFHGTDVWTPRGYWVWPKMMKVMQSILRYWIDIFDEWLARCFVASQIHKSLGILVGIQGKGNKKTWWGDHTWYVKEVLFSMKLW